MRRLCLTLGLPLVFSSCMLQAAHGADGVEVTVRLAALDVLEVSYELPAACTVLAFQKDGPGAAKIRARWRPQDECGTAGADKLERTQACPALRFRVPATTDKVSGYPGSYPVGAALYVHMSNYAVGTACGPVQYRYAAPGIAMAGAALSGQAAATDDSPALLFTRARPAGPEGLDYFDPALSPAAIAQIRSVADGTAAVLGGAMPRARFQRPILAAALASEPGGPNIAGSAGDVLLMSLLNWPAAPGPKEQRMLNKLVAHEMSHRFQLRDAVDVYPDARLIHEGGAEFLRWAVSLRKGWLTPQQAAAELDDALAACVLATGERSWREMPAREIAANWLEYSCGLPAYVYALAARQGKGTPFERIDAFYEQLRAGAQPDLAQALECGATPCKARILPALLEGRGPMRDQWSAVLRETGLAPARAPSQSHMDSMITQAITALVKDDCQGQSSITVTPSSLLLDTLRTCKSLRSDVEVVRVEGLPLFGGERALPAAVQACNKSKTVELGLKGGATLRMPCRVPYQMTHRFPAVDMDKVVEKLARP